MNRLANLIHFCCYRSLNRLLFIILYLLCLQQGAETLWETRSLVWGIWLSSLLVGYFFTILSFFRYLLGERRVVTDFFLNNNFILNYAFILRPILAIVSLVLSSFMFFLFHGLLGLFLFVLFPLISPESLGPSRYIPFSEAFFILLKHSLIGLVGILKIQWVLIVSYLIQQSKEFLRSPAKLFPDVCNHNTVRLHLIILCLWPIGLEHFGKLDHNFFIYAFALFFYMFDFRNLQSKDLKV